MRPEGTRARFAGPESGPQQPFPIKLRGPVIRGFGRGSKELSIPTANIPPEGLSAYPDLKSGIYFGYCTLQSAKPTSKVTGNGTEQFSTSSWTSRPDNSKPQVFQAVLSIGYNPYYKNSTRSIEIHVLHKFHEDFYGCSLNLLMLGFIRPEYDYVSKESLIEDILEDCEVAKRSLLRENWREESSETWEGWLWDFSWADDISQADVERVEAQTLGKQEATEGEVGRL
ncbi:riboflavin kinase [Elasticomyces elasticus]|nr:riboflavin kinase [Elasticomyces elasticus]